MRRGGSADKRLTGRKGQRRRRLFLMRNPLCVECEKEGRTQPAEEVDHIIPLFKGGPDTWANLQGLCKPHHLEKTAQDLRPDDIGCDDEGNPAGSDWW